jgi:hypothetical protein
LLQKHCSVTKRPPCFSYNFLLVTAICTGVRTRTEIPKLRSILLFGHFSFVPTFTVEYRTDSIGKFSNEHSFYMKLQWHRVCNKCNMRGASSGEGTAYPSGTPVLIPGFSCQWVWLLFMLDVFICLYWCPTQFPYQTMFVSYNSNTIGITSGVGTAYPSRHLSSHCF